ncbi:MAG: HNH nuclease family protein [Betaproteobacteria bacterium]|nr:HNH nuclease family protein [Betaproteobacteria bacterium]
MATRKSTPDTGRLARVIAEDRRARAAREKGYREQALKLYPWVCGRCAREFTHANLQLLEVHHRDSNHDNNPPDGSNWELLCTYCHEAEHRKYLDSAGRGGEAAGGGKGSQATYRPFENLGALLKPKPEKDRES